MQPPTTTNQQEGHKEKTTLINRLEEANLLTRRFLKVDAEKKAFEKEWQLNLYSPEELEHYPRWGIAGGDGLVPLEADKPEMVEILRTVLPQTLEVITPRRQLPHLFYKVTDGEVPNKVLHLPDDPQGAGEIRSQNQYFVAAGTTINFNDLETGEPRTGTYKILHDRPIAEISFADFMTAVTPYLGRDSSQRITGEIMDNGAEKGTRHAYGIKYASRLIRFEKLDPVATLDVMKRWNQKCNPPMNENDLERMIKKAIGYSQNDPTKDENTGTTKKEQIKYINRTGNYFTINKVTGKPVFVTKLLGDFLLTENHFVTDRKSRETFLFVKTHYKNCGETYIHEKCIEELGEYYKDSRYLEVLKYIKGKTYASFDKQPPLNLINVNNGILDVITKKLYQHDPKFLFFNVASLSYSNEGNVTPLLDFLLSITANIEDTIKLIKWLAYNFLRKNPYQLCLLLVGRTGAGKSVYFDASQNYLGPDNVTHRSLHELCTDKFACADLNGKLSNTCGDLPRSPLKYIDMFLRFVGGDSITIQKKYAHATSFNPTQKLGFASNQPPTPEDSQKAFFRRIMLIVCPNYFLGEDRDISILNKLITKEVRDGILALVADALNLLIYEGGFPIDLEETQKEYAKWANPMEVFFNVCINEESEKTLHKQKLFKTYANFCKKNSYNTESVKDFKNFIEDRAIYEKRIKNQRHWDGIEYTSEGLKYFNDKKNQLNLDPENTSAKLPKIEAIVTKSNFRILKYVLIEKFNKIGKLALVSKWLDLDANIYQDTNIPSENINNQYIPSECIYGFVDCQKSKTKTKSKARPKAKTKKQKTKLAKPKFNPDTAFPSKCFLCNNPVHEKDQLDKYENRTVHKKCKDKIEAQKKKPEKTWKCPKLGHLDGDPFCTVIQSILAKPEDCDPACSLLQGGSE